eukprot:134716-Prymnesium_polylepis.2
MHSCSTAHERLTLQPVLHWTRVISLHYLPAVRVLRAPRRVLLRAGCPKAQLTRESGALHRRVVAHEEELRVDRDVH